MRFYVIEYDDGRFKCGEFPDFASAYDWATENSNGAEFTLCDYDSEDDYFANL